MFHPTEHHPVADMGHAHLSNALEFFHDGFGTAKEHAVQIGVVVEFAVIRDSVDSAIADILSVQAALRTVLPARVVDLGIGFVVGWGNVGHTLQA